MILGVLSTGAIVNLCVGIAAVITSLATLSTALRNGRKTDAVHGVVNGRQTALERTVTAQATEISTLHAALKDRRATDPEGAPHA